MLGDGALAEFPLAGDVPFVGFIEFDGQGTISVKAILHAQIAATFSGTGSLSAVTKSGLAGPAVFSGSGRFSANVTSARLAAGALLAGSPSLSVKAALHALIRATLSGSGGLFYLGSISTQTSAVFRGTGSLSGNTGTLPPGGIVAEFDGSGGLVVGSTQQVISSGLVTFSGTGSLSPTVFLVLQAAAEFDGNGGLFLPLHGLGFLFGAGSLTANATLIQRMGFFAGAGSLTVNSYRIITVPMTMHGTGQLCVHAVVRKGGKPSLLDGVSGPGKSFNITVAGGP